MSAKLSMLSTFASSRKVAAVLGKRKSGPPQVRSSSASLNQDMSSVTCAGLKRWNFTPPDVPSVVAVAGPLHVLGEVRDEVVEVLDEHLAVLRNEVFDGLAVGAPKVLGRFAVGGAEPGVEPGAGIHHRRADLALGNAVQLFVGDAQVLVRAVKEVVIGILRQGGLRGSGGAKNTSLFKAFQRKFVAVWLLRAAAVKEADEPASILLAKKGGFEPVTAVRLPAGSWTNPLFS